MTKGKKNLTHLGNIASVPQQSTVNFFGPVLPRSAPKPSYGTLDVPVTNYSKRKRKASVSIVCKYLENKKKPAFKN